MNANNNHVNLTCDEDNSVNLTCDENLESGRSINERLFSRFNHYVKNNRSPPKEEARQFLNKYLEYFPDKNFCYDIAGFFTGDIIIQKVPFIDDELELFQFLGGYINEANVLGEDFIVYNILENATEIWSLEDLKTCKLFYSEKRRPPKKRKSKSGSL